MTTKHQFVTLEIPEEYTAAEREIIGEEIIDYIRERSQKGLNKRNREFPDYSPEYAKSLEFKIGGKKKGNVNLTLSGDMLGALTLLEHDDGRLVIGFENGTRENAIADGNIRGTYGKDAPGRVKRDFLGITKADLKRILGEHPPESLDEEMISAHKQATEIAKNATRSLSRGVEDGGGRSDE